MLLEAQERSQNSAMDLVVKTFQERTKILEDDSKELMKSLEFAHAEILDLKGNMKVLQKLVSDKQVVIDALQSRVVDLQERVNYHDDYSRRSNLRISGLVEQPSETWEQTLTSVTKFLQEKLQLPSVDLERAHRVGTATPSHPRTIVARFEKFGQREAALRNAKKLKGTGIYLNEDLCPASMEIKKKQIPLMKKAREEGKIAFFRHTKLIIKERTGQYSSSTGHQKEHRRDNDASQGSDGGSSPCETVVQAHSGADGPRRAGTVKPADGSRRRRVSSTECSRDGDVAEVPAGSLSSCGVAMPSEPHPPTAAAALSVGAVRKGTDCADGAQPMSTCGGAERTSSKTSGSSRTPVTRANTKNLRKKCG